jgi:transketolase
MRDAFAAAILKAAYEDEKIVFLTGDLGIFVFDEFQKEFPKRFYNMGIAEANMVGAAAGLALAGKTPVTYSIAPFMTARCLEQIRMDVCYHGLNVKFVAVGAGFVYGDQGASHHGTDDVSIMRAMPGMSIVCPADPLEVEAATLAMLKHDGPVYLRLPRNGEPVLDIPHDEFVIGKAAVVRQGPDATLITSGMTLKTVLDAADLLKDAGINPRVINVRSIKPIDREIIIAAAKETGAVVTIEEHSVVGALGSAVAEIIAESADVSVPFKMLGLPDSFCHEVGTQEYLQEFFGFSPKHIAESVKSLLA